ncbi:SAM-dependent methyltransferase [Wenzhouxiangella limi]|uniref:SAM-dependent methyltransferase n=1 Tax=Wenzhouxiangella limi TaxID=2707351 RepID=A0A845V0Z5_9GAMM|nr:SAM-dependent methyltransferase [Wenzhouxiangella limi]
MPFDRYMAMALYEPGLGYYVNGLHKFGLSGDFVTAPEEGSLFAAALARQIDEIAEVLGEPYTILEPGAGSGALARDLLLGLKDKPSRYLILEPSAALRQVQRDTLSTLPSALQACVGWLDAPPEESFTGVIIANEVADALPVSIFEITDKGLRERCVKLGNQRLEWSLELPRPRLKQAFEELTQHLNEALPVGYFSEISLDLPGWIETISRPLQKGAVLLVDYGYPRSEYYLPARATGTLICHFRHRAYFDPFVWPGLTDISAWVDFSAAAEAGQRAGLDVAGFATQADFLLALGAHQCVEQAEDEQSRLRLAGELKRLILPGEMGEKFKMLALSRLADCRLSGMSERDQRLRL